MAMYTCISVSRPDSKDYRGSGMVKHQMHDAEVRVWKPSGRAIRLNELITNALRAC